MVLNNEYLLNIKGGAITSSFLNSLARLIETLFGWGRSIGSSIYRQRNGKYCRKG